MGLCKALSGEMDCSEYKHYYSLSIGAEVDFCKTLNATINVETKCPHRQPPAFVKPIFWGTTMYCNLHRCKHKGKRLKNRCEEAIRKGVYGYDNFIAFYEEKNERK